MMNTPKIRIYIAGPMSGYPNLNWEAFDEKERQLTSAGFDVVNPARMDREIGLDPTNVGEYDYEEAAGRDIDALSECDAIYLMAGFQHSKGACWERALAKRWNLRRYYEIPRHDHEIGDFGPYGRYLVDSPLTEEIKSDSHQLEFEFADPISSGYSMKNSFNWEHP